MRKVVNGKVVDIPNIELFEKAEEGLALGKIATSNLDTKITVKAEVINKYLDYYKALYMAMPYPLYAIEEDIKYVAIATFLKLYLKDNLPMWVDKALYIGIDKESNTVLKLVGGTWGMVKCEEFKEMEIDIERYRDEVGYKEYKWLLEKIKNKESTSTFYKELMPDFVEACNSDPMILQWELSNILNFGSVPDKIELKNNTIIDLESGSEYILDIYYAGSKKTKEVEYVCSIFSDNDDVIRPKYVRIYKYDAYEKPSIVYENTDNNESNKLKKTSLIGLNTVFNTLVSIKMANDSTDFEDFTGILVDRYIIYSIAKRVFVCKAYRADDAHEIARGVELYSYDRGIVYFKKTQRITKDVSKEIIYSYSLRDGAIRLCSIKYKS